jgi:hypothetical protein
LLPLFFAVGLPIWAAAVVGAVVCVKLLGVKRPVDDVADLPKTGPVVAHGKLHGTATDGRDVVLAAGYFTTSGTEVASCRIEATDLLLTDGHATVRVALALARPSFMLGANHYAYEGRVADMPPTVRDLCEHWPEHTTGVSGARQDYRAFEFLLQDGVDVFVAGCRSGEMLAPCNDELDGMATSVQRARIPDDSFVGRGIRRRHEAAAALPFLRGMEVAMLLAAVSGIFIRWLGSRTVRSQS